MICSPSLYLFQILTSELVQYSRSDIYNFKEERTSLQEDKVWTHVASSAELLYRIHVGSSEYDVLKSYCSDPVYTSESP